MVNWPHVRSGWGVGVAVGAVGVGVAVGVWTAAVAVGLTVAVAVGRSGRAGKLVGWAIGASGRLEGRPEASVREQPVPSRSRQQTARIQKASALEALTKGRPSPPQEFRPSETASSSRQSSRSIPHRPMGKQSSRRLITDDH